MSIESYFAPMTNARSMAGGQHLKGEGKFVVLMKKMWVNDGHKGRFFIAEFEVEESSSPSDPVGSTRSWAVPMTGERAAYSFGDIKNLIFALTGREPRDCGSPEEQPALHAEATALVTAACDPAYAKKHGIDSTELIGLSVRLETRSKATKPSPQKPQGGTFTQHLWSPV